MYKLMLKELRKKAGFKSQATIAERLGIKERRYSTWERGEVELTIKDAYALCEVLGCTPNDLCNWYEDHPAETPKGLSDSENALLGNYRLSPPESRSAIEQVARMGAAARNQEAHDGSYEEAM